jgi:hypothetical protein
MFQNKQEVTYSVQEVNVVGYTTEITGDKTTGFTITNTLDTIDIPVTKTWSDNDDQDGIRPDSVTVRLLANGKAVDGKTLTLSEANGWAGKFETLPEYQNKQKVTYTVEEAAVDGYTTEITGSDEAGFVITNTYEPATTEVSGSKTWADADDQDGIRPTEIKINLLRDGKQVDAKTVTADDNWSWTFSGLDMYENHGVEVEYSITEDAIDGYELTGYEALDGDEGYNIALVNTHEPSVISIDVSKVWNDSDNLDGSRPDSVTVQLLANGEALEGKTLTLNEANGWAGTFADLPEYAEGEKIVYTIEEAAVEGYTTEITGSADEGFVITNSHEPVVEVVTTAQTGDSSNILLWMLSSIISGLTLVGAWIARRRRLA